MKLLKLAVFSISLLLFTLPSDGQDYANSEVVSSGGGVSGGGNYTNFGVVGETMVGESTAGGTYTNLSGFLTLHALEYGIPAIASFTPTSDTVGAEVIITGTNFSTTASDNTVVFNNATATVSIPTTTTSLTTTVPSGGFFFFRL